VPCGGDLWDVDGAGPDDKSDDQYRRGMATPAEASAPDLAQLLFKRVDAAAPLRSADITDTTVIARHAVAPVISRVADHGDKQMPLEVS
jgi:hypothetical protein